MINLCTQFSKSSIISSKIFQVMDIRLSINTNEFIKVLKKSDLVKAAQPKKGQTLSFILIKIN